MLFQKTNELALILSLAGLDGSVALAALSGLFRLENALTIGIVFLAGPTAILTAALMGGPIKERMVAALLAGIISTIVVVLAAGLGPKLLEFMNVNVLKIIGGIAVLSIGIMIMGVKIPEKAPLIIMLVGVLLSVLWR